MGGQHESIALNRAECLILRAKSYFFTTAVLIAFSSVFYGENSNHLVTAYGTTSLEISQLSTLKSHRSFLQYKQTDKIHKFQQYRLTRDPYIAPSQTLQFIASSQSNVKLKMFLNPLISKDLCIRTGMPSEATILEKAKNVKLTRNQNSYKTLTNERKRGILGFAIHDIANTENNPPLLHCSRSSSSRSQLYASSSPSQQPSWESPRKHMPYLSNPEGWETHNPSGMFLNPLLNRSPILTQTASEDKPKSSSSWVPWIPTEQQILSLKVVELKQVCFERGLKQTGKKLDLQERVSDWSHQQRRKYEKEFGGLTLRKSQSSFSVIDEKISRHEGQENRRYTKGEKNEYINKNKLRGNVGTGFEKTQSNRNPFASSVDTKESKSDSFDEWEGTVDIQPLLKRREKIHKGKLERKKAKEEVEFQDISPATTQEYRSQLKKVFDASSSVVYSNYDVKQLYIQAKNADQNGDRRLSKQMLFQLKDITPNDGRIYRRLSRMFSEEGDINQARAILHQGIRLNPNNGFLWHGLGRLELKIDDNHKEARRCFRRAVQCDPSIPHPYHAWGTLEHKQGRIAAATRTLKKGIEYCPRSHRLHHALGDVYREAKMLDMAEMSYRRALEHSIENVNDCFAYSALANVVYEQGNIDESRKWLKRAVSVNNGRHAQGWVALAHLEESEGNFESARSIYIAALIQYERGLIDRKLFFTQRKGKFQRENNGNKNKQEFKKEQVSVLLKSIEQEDAKLLTRKLLRIVPVYRSGDHFLDVYMNWARLEIQYGTEESVDEVFTRAAEAFTTNWKLMLGWARYHQKLQNRHRARELFTAACKIASNRHADPHRVSAEFEMSLGNYDEARRILYHGALQMLHSPVGIGSDIGKTSGGIDLVKLFHTWAICEWHCKNLSRSEVLFDHALRLTALDEEGLEYRSFLLYSIARLEYYAEEYHLAQHFIGLCLKENCMPGGNANVWELWSNIARDMGNESLARECTGRAREIQEEFASGIEPSQFSFIQGPDMQPLMNRNPWDYKLFNLKITGVRLRGNTKVSLPLKGFFAGVKFPV